MKSTFAHNASNAVHNSPTVCAVKEKHRVTHRIRAKRDTCAYARDSSETVVGDKSPASVAGRRGAPPYDATRKGLGSENSALLTQRGRIPQRCCHLQLCWLACDGTTRAKATAFNVRRSYFGPMVPKEGGTGGAAGHRTRVRSAYLCAFIAIVRLPGRVGI